MKKVLLIIMTMPWYLSAQDTTLAQEYLELAQSVLKKENANAALRYAQKALKHEPENYLVHSFLARLLFEQQDFVQAIEHYKKILAQFPSQPNTWHNIGVCYKNLGDCQEALSFFERALNIKPNFDNARQLRAEMLLKLGNYLHAWPDYEYRWRPVRPDAKKFAEFMHNNGDLRNKIVLLWGDFGLGDAFQFIRYAQKLKEKGARIIAQVQKSQLKIFALCPYIDQLIDHESPAPFHDLSTTLISLAWAFNTSINTIPQNIPYLYADKALIQSWQDTLKFDHHFKIGICWNGNSYNTQLLQNLVRQKSIPLKLLEPLSTIPGISLYSLQQTTGTDQLKGISWLRTFESFDDSHGRFMDTAALMKNLDLIITIDTSIVHLAGGLGIKTWLILPHCADWRWLKDRNDSPWYPTIKIFRQPKAEDWQSVVDQVISTLKNELSTMKQGT